MRGGGHLACAFAVPGQYIVWTVGTCGAAAMGCVSTRHPMHGATGGDQWLTTTVHPARHIKRYKTALLIAVGHQSWYLFSPADGMHSMDAPGRGSPPMAPKALNSEGMNCLMVPASLAAVTSLVCSARAGPLTALMTCKMGTATAHIKVASHSDTYLARCCC